MRLLSVQRPPADHPRSRLSPPQHLTAALTAATAAVLTAALAVSGCTPMIRADETIEIKRPVRVQLSYPLALTPPVLEIPKGTLVGGHAMNPTKAYQHVHEWGTTFDVDQMELNHPLRDELTSHGYRFAIGSRATFQLKATITRIVYNLFGSDPRAGWSEAQVTVRWELSGPTSIMLVTDGVATTRQHSLASLFNAFRGSLRNFLANEVVAAAVAPKDLKPSDIAVAQPVPIAQPDPRPVPVVHAGPRPAPVVQPEAQPPVTPPETPVPLVTAPGTPGTQPGAPAIRRVLVAPPGSTALLDEEAVVSLGRQGVVTVLAGDGWGSGTVISNDGYVLTTAHLVDGEQAVSVVTMDGREIGARVEATNRDLDVALLRAGAKDLNPLLVRLSPVAEGDQVVAIGTPFHPALSHSTSRGRIGALRGSQVTTDVRVSSGNTGGPVLDARGQVVGIVAWPIGRETPSAQAACVRASEVFRGLGLAYAD